LFTLDITANILRGNNIPDSELYKDYLIIRQEIDDITPFMRNATVHSWILSQALTNKKAPILGAYF